MSAQGFFKNKTTGFYIFAVSGAAALIAAVTYVLRGGDVLTTATPTVTILLSVGIILNILLSIKDVKPLEIVPFILYLAAFLVFIDTEITFISNVIMGIDGNAIDGAFVLYSVMNIIAVVAGMAAAIMKIEKD